MTKYKTEYFLLRQIFFPLNTILQSTNSASENHRVTQYYTSRCKKIDKHLLLTLYKDGQSSS
jgi:hypothetical protein